MITLDTSKKRPCSFDESSATASTKNCLPHFLASLALRDFQALLDWERPLLVKGKGVYSPEILVISY